MSEVHFFSVLLIDISHLRIVDIQNAILGYEV